MNTLPHRSFIVFNLFIASNVKVSFQVGQSLLKRVEVLRFFLFFSCKRPNSTETHHFEICLHQLSLCKELQCGLWPVVASKRSWQDFKTKLARFQNQRVASIPHGIPQWIGRAHHQVGGGAKMSKLLSKTEKQFVANEIQKKKKAKQHLAKLASRESWLT